MTSFYSIDSRPDIMGTLDYIRDYIRAIGSQLEAISASVPWDDFLLSRFMFKINCTVVQNSDFIKKVTDLTTTLVQVSLVYWRYA